MREPFPIIEVQTEQPLLEALGGRLVEPMGTKRKFWFPAGAGQWFLFKYPRPGTGEHWSEKVAAEIGEALHVPCAEVFLASFDSHLGCCVRSFAPPASELTLVHGNELLQALDASYPKTQVHAVALHTVSAVLGALQGTTAPPDVEPGPLTGGAAWFVGYLLLDALILNSDRHHENWGVLERQDGVRTLAPSYDHASSLGRELTDEQRLKRMTTRDQGYSVAAYVARARSAFFRSQADAKPLHPAEAFFAAAELDRAAAEHWLARLDALAPAALDDIVSAVPSSAMSDASRRFALEMMRIARARLRGTV